MPISSESMGTVSLLYGAGANVAGIPINDFCELRGHYQHQESMERIYKTVRDSAYDIIQKRVQPIMVWQWRLRELQKALL